jgi:hypothetical protein
MRLGVTRHDWYVYTVKGSECGQAITTTTTTTTTSPGEESGLCRTTSVVRYDPGRAQVDPDD